jgi:RNA polymerase sigma factor (sigma-70 family)
MATKSMNRVMQRLRHAALRGDGAGLTDGQLLERFLSVREEAAFGALVRRHGSIVMGVCRRVLGNTHDAEDAFQATFLVLARKAASVVPRELVGHWLYGVAYRTALKARAVAARWRRVERQVKNMPEREALAEQGIWSDLQPVLDHELNRLPEKYRIPIVLCEMEGKSKREVARALSLPEGTVSSRLARARRILRERLSRRGLALSSGTLGLLLSQSAASASVPAPLVVSTSKAAMTVAAGGTATSVSAKVAALTEGVLRAMLLKKLAVQTVVLALVLVVATAGARLSPGFGGDTKQSVNNRKSETITQLAQKPPKEADKTDPRKSWRVRSSFKDHTTVHFPDGKTLALGGVNNNIDLYDWPSGKLRTTVEIPGGGRVTFSPDGKTLATASHEDKVITLWNVVTGKERGAFRGHTDKHRIISVAFSPDKKTVASASVFHKGGEVNSEVKLWDAKTRQEITIVHQANNEPALTGAIIRGLAFSPDGKALAMAAHDRKIRLWDLAKKEERWASDQWPEENTGITIANSLVFSPDGKTLAVAILDHVKLFDAATGKESATLEMGRPEKGQLRTIFQLAFTPDGKTLAACSSRVSGKKGQRAFHGLVKLWDTLTHKEITTIDCKMGIIQSLAFSSDGKILATGGATKNSLEAETGRVLSEAGIVKLWEMKGAK